MGQLVREVMGSKKPVGRARRDDNGRDLPNARSLGQGRKKMVPSLNLAKSPDAVVLDPAASAHRRHARVLSLRPRRLVYV